MILPQHYAPIKTSVIQTRASIGTGSGIAAGGVSAANSNNNKFIIGFSVAVGGTLLIVGIAYLYRKGYLHRAVGKQKKPRPANKSLKNRRPKRKDNWPWRGVTLKPPSRTYQREKNREESLPV